MYYKLLIINYAKEVMPCDTSDFSLLWFTAVFSLNYVQIDNSMHATYQVLYLASSLGLCFYLSHLLHRRKPMRSEFLRSDQDSHISVNLLDHYCAR